jgi:hypothetical protein
LKNDEPVYIKQFRIPDAHRDQLHAQVNEWLKHGIIDRARSPYNCSIFMVPKKNGQLRIVQDFRALNANSHIEKYSMKCVSECIGDIGRAGQRFSVHLI